MAMHQEGLERVRLAPETGGFGVEEAIGNFIELPVIAGSVKMNRPEEFEEPNHAKQRLDDIDVGVAKPKIGTTFEFDTNLETFDTKATDGVTPDKSWIIHLLESSGFTTRACPGTQVSGTSSTSLIVNVDDASGFRAGCAMGLVNPSTGQLELREIQTISANAIAVKQPFGFTPNVADATVYGTYSCKLNDNPNGAAGPYLQFTYEGYSPFDRYLFRGCRAYIVGLKGWEPDGKPVISWKADCATWDYADGTATTMDLQGPTLGEATYINTQLQLTQNADYRITTIGDTSLPAYLHATAMDFTPNLVFQRIATPSGQGNGAVNNTRGYYRLHQPPCLRGAFKLPLEDLSLASALTLKSKLRMMLQTGSIPAQGACLMSIPTLQLMKTTDPRAPGVRELTYEWRARRDEEAVSDGGSEADDAMATGAWGLHFA